MFPWGFYTKEEITAQHNRSSHSDKPEYLSPTRQGCVLPTPAVCLPGGTAPCPAAAPPFVPSRPPSGPAPLRCSAGLVVLVGRRGGRTCARSRAGAGLAAAMPKARAGKRPRRERPEGKAPGEAGSWGGRPRSGGSWVGWAGQERRYGCVCVTLCCSAGILFNTGAGQHILKNPLVVNSIIEKVGAGGAEPAGG